MHLVITGFYYILFQGNILPIYVVCYINIVKSNQENNLFIKMISW